MQEKFEKLFYEFEKEEVNAGDWCISPQPYFHGAKNIEGATLNLGYQTIKAPFLLDREPHAHREEEYLVFLGTTLPDIFPSFDAEIHLFLGKNLNRMEKIVITEPSVVRIPRGWWHDPLNFVRVDKPVFFQAINQAPDISYVKLVELADGEKMTILLGDDTKLYEEQITGPWSQVKWTVVNEDGVESYTVTGAYDAAKAPKATDSVLHPGFTPRPYSETTTLKVEKPKLSDEVAKCVLVCPKEVTQWGEWCPCPQFYFRGQTYMENASYHVGYQVFTGPNDMEEPHMHMGAEEYIFFMGTNPLNFFDFDCEITFAVGDDPDHMETKVITKPTVARMPPNVWHCPILFRKMKKPVMFQAAIMTGTWGTINRMAKSTGEDAWELKNLPFSRTNRYEYMGDDVRLCKFDESRRCIICGACEPNNHPVSESIN